MYARNATDPRCERVAAWLEQALNGPARVGLAWPVLTGFVRIATNARIMSRPLPPTAAWAQVEEWLDAPCSWVPTETPQHARVMGQLIARHDLSGPIVSDAHLVALAIEHGVAVASTDGDFARFDEIQWINPLREPLE